MTPFEPPTLEEVEDYVRAKNLNVDPGWWWNYFDAGDWIKSNGKPVTSWKQTLWTHSKMNDERTGKRPCHTQDCKGDGVYPDGHDRDGHPYYRCIDHKPAAKPATIDVKMQEITPVVKLKVWKERKRLGL